MRPMGKETPQPQNEAFQQFKEASMRKSTSGFEWLILQSEMDFSYRGNAIIF